MSIDTEPLSQEQIEAQQEAAGIIVNETVQEDYFGFSEDHQWTFPDGKTFIAFKIMNEGSKAKYQKKTNKDVNINQNSKDMRIRMDPAQERWELLKASVTGWNLIRNGQPIFFSEQNFTNWLEVANPKHVQELERVIRLANPWMQDEMTVDQINEERDRLDELETAIRKREAEKADSFGK